MHPQTTFQFPVSDKIEDALKLDHTGVGLCRDIPESGEVRLWAGESGEAMNHMLPLTKLQIFAIMTVALSDILAFLGFYGGLWWVATSSILICLVGASILEKMNK
jgi:hypothetical protein